MTDFKLASKSLSVKIKLDTSFTFEQPDPIANPTSACYNASISLIPSPVTDTFFPNALSPTSNKNLSLAVALARTLRFGKISSSNPYWFERPSPKREIPPTNSLNSSPVIID